MKQTEWICLITCICISILISFFMELPDDTKINMYFNVFTGLLGLGITSLSILLGMAEKIILLLKESKNTKLFYEIITSVVWLLFSCVFSLLLCTMMKSLMPQNFCFIFTMTWCLHIILHMFSLSIPSDNTDNCSNNNQ